MYVCPKTDIAKWNAKLNSLQNKGPSLRKWRNTDNEVYIVTIPWANKLPVFGRSDLYQQQQSQWYSYRGGRILGVDGYSTFPYLKYWKKGESF